MFGSEATEDDFNWVLVWLLGQANAFLFERIGRILLDFSISFLQQVGETFKRSF